jgi:hypothetical protein
MRDLFPGYYQLSEEEFSELWNNCVFILDTNVILNLYRYNKQTCEDFITVLRKIEHRLWIPHQVALEFQKNRTTVIEEQENKFVSIEKILNEAKSSLKGEIRKFPSINHESFLEKLDKLFKEFLEETKLLETQQLKSEQKDFIRDIIDDIFKGKIGEPPTKEELKKIYEEGEERYKNNYPPGYKDKSKNQQPYLHKGMSFKREYGDLILWKQILKEVDSKKLKYIIFITADEKEDWWLIEHGKTIGARPELVEEICKAGASIFYMYTPERFLEFVTKYIVVDVKEESIEQVKDIADLSRGSANTTGVHVENAVLKWLESEYPNDKITRSAFDSSSVDFFRLITEDQSRIGYEIKFLSGSGLQISERLRQIRRFMRLYYGYKNLKKVYLILVVFDNHINDSQLVGNVLTILGGLPPNNLSLIIGRVTLESDFDETLELIFKPLHFVN